MQTVLNEIEQIPPHRLYGRVAGVRGLTLEVCGAQAALSVGSRCAIQTRDGRSVMAEVVGFHDEAAALLPFGTLDGIGMGCRDMVDREYVIRREDSFSV